MTLWTGLLRGRDPQAENHCARTFRGLEVQEGWRCRVAISQAPVRPGKTLGEALIPLSYLWLRNESAGVDCLLRDRAAVPLEKWSPLSWADRPTDFRHTQLGCLGKKKDTFWPFKRGRLVQYSFAWGAPALLPQRPDAMSVKSVQSFPISYWLLLTNPWGNGARSVSWKPVFMSDRLCTWVSFRLTFLYILWLAAFPKSIFLSFTCFWWDYGNH